MKNLIFVSLVLTGSVSLLRPWIGIIGAYLFIILTPQCIWWWSFSGIQRPVYWILVPTIVGFGIGTLRKKISLIPLKSKLNLILFLLWCCFIISYLCGPYVDVHSEYRFTNPKMIINLINKIFVLYFMAVCCIDSKFKLKCLVLVIIVSTIYLIWWANSQYFFYHHYGRLGGPTPPRGVSIYADENTFGMLFVVALPFLYYAGLYTDSLVLRGVLWICVIFGWHAIFLTGSRGALVGLIVTLLLACMMSSRKKLFSTVLIIFAIFYSWQAGVVMKNRFSTITHFESEHSASTRLEAWQAALRMIWDNPVCGVGVASFGPAFPYYSSAEPRVAHNSLLEVAAETGVLGGVLWLLIFPTLFSSYRRNLALLRQNKDMFFSMLNESLLISFSGFFVCSMFLSLEVYEIFYFLCVLHSTCNYLLERGHDTQEVLQPAGLVEEAHGNE